MSERLTDAELDEALQVARDLSSLRLTAAIAELRDRRARDLTDEDREALHLCAQCVRETLYARLPWQDAATVERRQQNATWRTLDAALAVLDKLLGGAS